MAAGERQGGEECALLRPEADVRAPDLHAHRAEEADPHRLLRRLLHLGPRRAAHTIPSASLSPGVLWVLWVPWVL
ncbi:hypothetical protein GCM10010252_68410 [Streptomyces aureoverticillatus]|nr:hypothetical protein GCM10010252_68410 [Streptomyces aureoverticillatus]